MVWGTGAPYTEVAETIAAEYDPGDLHPVQYQSIPWANWYQTFTSAVASGTGPAVSTGASFQPFFFLEQGTVAPADGAIDLLEADGKADFLPGILDAMNTDQGYAGIPWGLDLRVFWYRESILQDAGLEPPTTWPELLEVGKRLREIDVVGLGLAAGSDTTDAQKTIVSLMISNGGGLFNENAEPDVTNEANVETLEFVLELVREGVIDPRSVSYNADNLDSDWSNGRVGMGFHQTGLDRVLSGEVAEDVRVASPLVSPNGLTGSLYYINSIMLYTDTPDEASGEEFAAWYAAQTDKFWTDGVMIDLPVTERVAALPEITENPNVVKSIEEWQPVGKTIAAQSPQAFGALNSVDGGSAMASFVQRVVQGESDALPLLETLQADIEELMG
ncbi:ABC transporter substrate-binding protein [Ruania halotolerans]|uniref:ABC transporter substrate-binding protein n=1 Tax=Ruania halotolerans TaxID=2897773 RepID=UPI001E59BB66|nr:extracellular solute-binding protein [Ruania halotolerans]UFU06228.1 extracellular solute-binding protein [Ruania halotolerans]